MGSSSVPAASIPADLVAYPGVGRLFETSRPVRLGDATTTGRLRLDALARILQDVGADDMADAGLDPTDPWVARRTDVSAHRWPRFGERLLIATFCSALGPRWGERRTSLRTEAGGHIETSTLWVHVDAQGRPASLDPGFVDCYQRSAAGRRVTTRRSLPGPPAELQGERPWVLRASDLDALGHVNNAAALAAVEDLLWQRGEVPRHTAVEYVAVIDPFDQAQLGWRADESLLGVWLTVAGNLRLAAQVSAG